jgi:nitronate monooxygenase
VASPTLHTPLCDFLEIEYPICSAGMGPVAGGAAPVATHQLVAAVSNAGGLGVIGGVAYAAADLRAEIRAVRELTDKPFGVDLLLSENFLVERKGDESAPGPDAGRDLVPAETRDALKKMAADLGVEWREDPNPPIVSFPPVGKSWAGHQIEVVLEENVPVFASGLGTPAPFAQQLKENGTKILSLVGNVRAARSVAQGGADVVVAQGTEAGGHTGRIGTLALAPQVMDAVAPKPVMAAGGVSDGRNLAAVLAMGCVGAWCGTVFLVSEEANQPELQKRRILEAAAEDTIVTRLYSGKTMRNIKNPLIQSWEASGIRALPMGLQGLLTRDLLYSIRQAGLDELLMNAAGQTAGLLKEIRPAKEILLDLVGEAADALSRRLPSTVQAAVA